MQIISTPPAVRHVYAMSHQWYWLPCVQRQRVVFDPFFLAWYIIVTAHWWVAFDCQSRPYLVLEYVSATRSRCDANGLQPQQGQIIIKHGWVISGFHGDSRLTIVWWWYS